MSVFSLVAEKWTSLFCPAASLFSTFFVLCIVNFSTKAAEYNIFEGLECHGGPALVMSQGRVVYEEGKLQAQQGTGRFIPRKPFPDYAYQRIKFRNQVQNIDDLMILLQQV